MDTHEEIFAVAKALPEEARAAYLDEACETPAQREEVEKLLRAADRAQDFFADFDQTEEGGAGVPEGPGTVIGPYKILQQIGEGGFGVVFMAEQEKPIARRVALKIIKPGMDSRNVVARFEAERQALALMDHPNIAKIFEAGTTAQGRPYFAMELVKGVPLTDFCDEHHCDLRQRLDLFLEVCRAVNHAHQKGVIHRDLKPSNVLVTLHGDQPVPKIIDFGIAKATQQKLTDKTLFTRFEQFIGTPMYMSPEQAALSGLDIDTRSDIYALGVLLYELLSGKPPFDRETLLSAGYDEMRRIIRESEPPRPSVRLATLSAEEATSLTATHGTAAAALRAQVRGDLDWIVMKAIEKERERRYATGNALALDIERFLHDEPVTAVAPSGMYRFRKFARRNKAALAVAAAMLVLLVLGTGVSTWQAIRANRIAAAEAAAREDAEAVTAFLSEVFRSPDPRRSGRDITVAEMLDQAVEKLEQDTETPERRKARLRVALGDTYRALGLPEPAVELHQQALEHYRAALGEAHDDTRYAMFTLASSLHRAGRPEEALKLREKVVELQRELFGPEHPDTLSAVHNLASSYEAAGRPADQLALREEVLELRMKVNGPEHTDTLKAMSRLANCYEDVGRLKEALALREKVLKLRRKADGPEHPDTLYAMHNLAMSYDDFGRHDEAMKLREEGLERARTVLGPDHSHTLAAMNNLASSSSDLGRYEEALRMREEVLKRRRKALGPDHRDTVAAMGNLAISYDDLGRYPEALELCGEVLERQRESLGPDHPDTLNAMQILANSYDDLGRYDEALEVREEVLERRREADGPDHPETVTAMHNLANSYSNLGRYEEALELIEEVLERRRKVGVPDHPDTVAAMKALASSLWKVGRYEESLTLGERVLERYKKFFGPENPKTLGAMHNLANSYDDAGRLERALLLREKVLELREAVLGPEHPATLWAMAHLGVSLRKAGRHDESLKLEEKVLEMRKAILGPEHPETLSAMHNLAISYDAAGRQEEALDLREKVLERRKTILGEEHPETISAMSNLANSYYTTGRREEALNLREKVLERRKTILGEEHPDTLSAMRNLAISYRAMGREKERLGLLEEHVALQRAANGSDSPALNDAISAFGRALGYNGQLERAREVLQELSPDLEPNTPESEKADRLRSRVLDLMILAALHLRAADGDAYRTLCRDLVVLAEETDDEIVIERASKSCLVAPPGEDSPYVAKAFAAARTMSGSQSERWEAFTCGLAEYRAGNPDTALQKLEQARSVPGSLALQALARQQRGDRERALESLLQAEANDSFGTDREGELWWDRLIGRLLLEEASERILGRKPEPPEVRAVLVAPDAAWKWLHPTDGIDPANSDPDFHETFFTAGFDDSNWNEGPDGEASSSGFAYGESGFEGVDLGQPARETDRHSAYFRYSFETDKPHTTLVLRCRRDDGIIVYLDGREVVRDNVEPGSPGYRHHALRTVGGEEETQSQVYLLPGALEAGAHILAISVHNTESPSSDLRLGPVTLESLVPPDAVGVTTSVPVE